MVTCLYLHGLPLALSRVFNEVRRWKGRFCHYSHLLDGHLTGCWAFAPKSRYAHVRTVHYYVVILWSSVIQASTCSKYKVWSYLPIYMKFRSIYVVFFSEVMEIIPVCLQGVCIDFQHNARYGYGLTSILCGHLPSGMNG